MIIIFGPNEYTPEITNSNTTNDSNSNGNDNDSRNINNDSSSHINEHDSINNSAPEISKMKFIGKRR